MENYATTQITIYHLRSIHEHFSKPENWCQGEEENGSALRLDDLLIIFGGDGAAHDHSLDRSIIFPGDLSRGQIPEPAWFVRQAMNASAPEFDGLFYKWNDAPGRTHEEVLDLIMAALDLARGELAQILASDDNFDISGLVLHRWGDRDGTQLCAMSALSQKLGYRPLTDIPMEMDPGLAALVNLLNDRAPDKARQLLTSRLKYLPNTGRTDICDLISRVFFPKSIAEYGYEEEAGVLAPCDSREALAAAYASISERFLKPDGELLFATGCITLSAALKASDPTEQDLLAISAASQLVSFEMGWGWVDLLNILDFVLGLEDSPSVENDQSYARYHRHFAGSESFPGATEITNQGAEDRKRPTKLLYDFGIEVRWFPALVEKFPDRLEEVAKQILSQVAALDTVDVDMHRFSFGGEDIMIVTHWDDDLDILCADADLVAYMDPSGEIDLDGDGDAIPLLIPVPASEADSVH
jgi:hypothetical protein